MLEAAALTTAVPAGADGQLRGGCRDDARERAVRNDGVRADLPTRCQRQVYDRRADNRRQAAVDADGRGRPSVHHLRGEETSRESTTRQYYFGRHKY
jgi:hypothetical protein